MDAFTIDLVGINPEPWEIGDLSVGRKGGKVYPIVAPSLRLKTYQESVREEIKRLRPDAVDAFNDAEKLSVRFLFWRQIETSQTRTGRARKGKVVDATNLQKGAEDALQGVLFPNDTVDVEVFSRIVDQGSHVTMPIIHIEVIRLFDPDHVTQYFEGIRRNALDAWTSAAAAESEERDNEWPPRS